MTPSENKPLTEIISGVLSSRSFEYGLTSKEIAEIVGKSPSHVSQIVKKLFVQDKISRSKRRRGTQRRTSVYYQYTPKDGKQPKIKQKIKDKTCGNCQRYTALERCSLLDLVMEKKKLEDKELLQRYQKECLASDTPECEFFDPRVNGKYRSKGVNDFIRRNTSNGYSFQCPIERCGKTIRKLSNPLMTFKIGFSTIFCPHCGSPMVMKFDDQLKRYEIRYWDARFDVLQKDYKKLTGKVLVDQKSASEFGVTVHKEAFHYLDLKNQFLVLSGSPITDEQIEKTIYLPLRELDYLSFGCWSDYFYFKDKLHAEYLNDFEEPRKLHEKIRLLEPRIGPESLNPNPLEVGGNEIFIATKVRNSLCLRVNLQNREVLLDAVNSETNNSSTFLSAKKRIRNYINKLSIPADLDFNYWQQLEGGCGSLMYKPFKEEAKKYGFFAPSREMARKVRGEYFLPFILYAARSNYHSAINAVNHIVGVIIKELAYTQQELAFDGFRGWCHRNYTLGLFYDKFELAKLIALFCINRAIREERLIPSHFITKRGKRFDLIYGVKSSSDGEEILQKIAKDVLQTKIVSLEDKNTTVIQYYKRLLDQHHKLFSALALSSSKIILSNKANKNKITPWKLLQQTKDPSFLPRKIFSKLKKHTHSFLRDEMPFQPLGIQEILISG